MDVGRRSTLPLRPLIALAHNQRLVGLVGIRLDDRHLALRHRLWLAYHKLFARKQGRRRWRGWWWSRGDNADRGADRGAGERVIRRGGAAYRQAGHANRNAG